MVNLQVSIVNVNVVLLRVDGTHIIYLQRHQSRYPIFLICNFKFSGTFHQKRQHKTTWEVIRDSPNLHSYEMKTNPRYKPEAEFLEELTEQQNSGGSKVARTHINATQH
jgi:hypothetical protein